MKKKILAVLLAASLLTTLFVSCGKSDKDSGDSDGTKLKIGVTGAMYDDVWSPAVAKLADEGIDVEIVQFSDYTLPNNALNNHEIDLNAFQQSIFLENEIQQYGYDIEKIGYTFIIPLNLYSVKVKSVDELKDGDTVALPDDVANQGRALKVLEASGLIKLKSDAGFSPSISDIESYKVNINLKELKANTIPSALQDVDAAIINGNYSIDFGISPDSAIFKDTILPREYWCFIAARTEDLADAEKVATYRKVVEAFQTEDTNKVFNDRFGGFFVAVGWDEDLLEGK